MVVLNRKWLLMMDMDRVNSIFSLPFSNALHLSNQKLLEIDKDLFWKPKKNLNISGKSLSLVGEIPWNIKTNEHGFRDISKEERNACNFQDWLKSFLNNFLLKKTCH